MQALELPAGHGDLARQAAVRSQSGLESIEEGARRRGPFPGGQRDQFGGAGIADRRAGAPEVSQPGAEDRVPRRVAAARPIAR